MFTEDVGTGIGIRPADPNRFLGESSTPESQEKGANFDHAHVQEHHAELMNGATEPLNAKIAAAYCSLRVIATLTLACENHHIFMDHPQFLPILDTVLRHPLLHNSVREAVLDIVRNLITEIPVNANVNGSLDLFETLTKMLPQPWQRDPKNNETEAELSRSKANFEKVLFILQAFARRLEGESTQAELLCEVVASHIEVGAFAANVPENLLVLAYILADTMPMIARDQSDFVRSLIQAIPVTDHADHVGLATEALSILHRERPLYEFTREVHVLYMAAPDAYVDILGAILADLFLGPLTIPTDAVETEAEVAVPLFFDNSSQSRVR